MMTDSGRLLGKALIAASLIAQIFYIAIAGGAFGDPGRANWAALLLICVFLLSLVIVGAALLAASATGEER